jgi:hypothetical protein
MKGRYSRHNFNRYRPCRKGYLKIQEVETTKFIFFSDRDYKLIKLKEPTGNELKQHERRVFSCIFSGDKREVMVSDLSSLIRHGRIFLSMRKLEEVNERFLPLSQ